MKVLIAMAVLGATLIGAGIDLELAVVGTTGVGLAAVGGLGAFFCSLTDL